MGFLIGALFIIVFAIAFLIAGIALERESNIFEKNKRFGQAEVVGYCHPKHSTWHTLLVRIPELNDGNFYGCKSGNINKSQYPVGTVVDVMYAPQRVVGINLVEVHLIADPPTDSLALGRGFKKFSIAMFVFAGILAVVGIITII